MTRVSLSRAESIVTTLDRMVLAVERVRDRLLRATAALEAAGIPYAVTGGNAVAAWVARIDAGAVRNTRDVDLLVRRDDLEAIRNALETAGFSYRHAAGVDMFLDGPDASARDAVHLVFAGEMIREDDPFPNEDLATVERFDDFAGLPLDALVRMKLNSFRRKDQVHVLDLHSVGLVDESWLATLPSPLDERLRELLDDPDG